MGVVDDGERCEASDRGREVVLGFLADFLARVQWYFLQQFKDFQEISEDLHVLVSAPKASAGAEKGREIETWGIGGLCAIRMPQLFSSLRRKSRPAVHSGLLVSARLEKWTERTHLLDTDPRGGRALCR